MIIGLFAILILVGFLFCIGTFLVLVLLSPFLLLFRISLGILLLPITILRWIFGHRGHKIMTVYYH